MEHVLNASGIKNLTIEVPYLCKDSFEYDTEIQFSKYGQTLDYDNAKALFLKTQENAREFAEILQKWLFFRLVIECFEAACIKITTDSFLRTTKDKRKVICTAGLNDLLQKWANAMPTLPPEMRSATALKIQADCHVAQVKLKHLGKIFASPVSEVLLSICVVAAPMIFAMRHVFRAGGTCPVPEWTDTTAYRSWGKSRLIVNNMISKGWCPYEVAQLYGGSFSALGMVFAASLKRPQRRETHENCTEKICRAFDVDESTYKTRHVMENCTCNDVNFEHERLCSIIKSGGIAVLRLGWDFNNQLKSEVVSSRGHRYIAISHVWSDGLGNTIANSLPECQLKQLDKTVRSLLSILVAEPVYIWLDTICVTAREVASSCPADIGGLDCRRLAILRMRDSYRDATEVLVLDWQLQNSVATAVVEENLVRILVSGWMRRLWTFQEAWLARKLWVQFKNKLICLSEQLCELDMQDHLPLWAEVADGFLSTQKGILSDSGQDRKSVV